MTELETCEVTEGVTDSEHWGVPQAVARVEVCSAVVLAEELSQAVAVVVSNLPFLLESAKDKHSIGSKYRLTVSDNEVFEADSNTFSPVLEVAVADVT